MSVGTRVVMAYDFGLEAAFGGGAGSQDFAPDYAGAAAFEGAAGD